MYRGGRVAPGLWIESFAIKPMDRFELETSSTRGSPEADSKRRDERREDVRHQGHVGALGRFRGAPQAWTQDRRVRLRVQRLLQVRHHHRPLRNGAPCRSTVANDPLEGLQVTFKGAQARQAGRPGQGLKPRAASAAQPVGRQALPSDVSGSQWPRLRRRDSASRAAGSAARTRRGTPQAAIPENHTADDDAASARGPLTGVVSSAEGAVSWPTWVAGRHMAAPCRRSSTTGASCGWTRRVGSSDILADLTDLSPIESGSVDAIWASHCIEHLYQHQVPVALTEFRRVLRDDGFVCVWCPICKRSLNTSWPTA